MKTAKTSAAFAALALGAGLANGELVEDQVGATFASGGFGGLVAQSFTPSLNTLAAIDVYISGTAALEADVTVEVFSGFDGENLTGMLASKTLLGVERFTTARFEFDSPLMVNPEQLYYFSVEAGLLGVATNLSNEYTRGQVVLPSGVDNADIIFSTFAVPAPSGLGLVALGGLVAARRRR